MGFDREQTRKELTNTLLELLKDGSITKGDLFEFVERATYEASMKFTNGNQVQAAALLGVARGTIRNKLHKYFSTTKVGGLYHIAEKTNDDDVQRSA
ncbi:MAG: hypothetical protein HRT87_10555 [Legionellales bacterium]|nr:hypothetical protein [Legionellales bacterium]